MPAPFGQDHPLLEPWTIGWAPVCAEIDAAIANRFQFADKCILAAVTLAGRTYLKCKACRLSIRYCTVCFRQMLHQARSNIARLANQYPLDGIRETINS